MGKSEAKREHEPDINDGPKGKGRPGTVTNQETKFYGA